MVRFTVSTSVRASQERTFELLSDFANAPTRIRGITRVEVVTPGPVRPGTRFRETRRMFKREATVEMEILSIDPPRSYVVGCDTCGSRYRTEFDVAANDSGATISATFNVEPISFFAKLMSPLMRPMLKACARACEEDLADIKRALEGSAP